MVDKKQVKQRTLINDKNGMLMAHSKNDRIENYDEGFERENKWRMANTRLKSR